MRSKWFVVWVLVLMMPVFGLSGVVPVPTPTVTTPSQIGTGVMGADAGILGMGGTGVVLCDNPYAPFWNPAGLALLKGFHMPFSIAARVENIDTVSDWSDLLDILDKDNPTIDDWNKAKDIANKVSGKTVVGEITPFFALSGNRFAVSFYGSAIGSGVVHRPQSIPPTQERISSDVGAYYLANFSFSIAGGKEKRLWGVNLRSIRGEFTPYYGDITYDSATGSVTSTTKHDTISDSAFGLDFGMLWLGEKGNRYGLVLKNINAPKLFSGAYELKLDRDMDVGYANVAPNGTFAIQLTNALTKARLDLGGELRWGILALRFGILDGKPIWGLGLGKGYFRLDVALGTAVKEKVALNFSLF